MPQAAMNHPYRPLTDVVGPLYAAWVLDGLTELAHAISVDVFARPQLYTGDSIPTDVGGFRTEWGSSNLTQDAAQRQGMLTPIFGRSDGLKPDATVGTSSFHVARKKFIDACIAYSERAVDSGLAMLEQRVRSAMVPFRAHFDGLTGRALDLAASVFVDQFRVAVRILRADGVAAVFGLPAPGDHWPTGNFDPNGAKLVESAGAALAISPDSRFTFTRFVLLQRVAQEGSGALELLLGTDPSAPDITPLITRGYTWGTSLRDFQSGG